MPLGAATTTDTTTAPIMALHSQPNTPSPASSRDPSPTTSHQFDETQCLFCNHHGTDLAQNTNHMSKAHGFYIDTTHLIVDILDLLAYCHLVISECHECLYCGTQRNSLQGVQQHMTAKGHCKYDLEDGEGEFRDFFDFATSDTTSEYEEGEREEERDTGYKQRTERLQGVSLAGSRRSTRRKQTKRAAVSESDAQAHREEEPVSLDHQDTNNTAPSPSTQPAATPSPLNQLSNRALKKEIRADTQLSHLRASDRAALAHLPSSQQRALLAVHHDQTVKARKEEQTQRGRLESAGNAFGRLGTTRLVRIPPHLGHVQTLKR